MDKRMSYSSAKVYSSVMLAFHSKDDGSSFFHFQIPSDSYMGCYTYTLPVELQCLHGTCTWFLPA